MKDLLLSSTGSGELSMTLKGLFVLLLPIAIQFANNHGVAITQDVVMQGVASIAAIVGQILLCIGLIRKFINWAKLFFTPAEKV